MSLRLQRAGRELLVIRDQISMRRDTLPPILDQDAAMKQRWTVQEIVASLEEQAAFPRDREAFHASREVLHQERRREHATELPPSPVFA
jgi:hypothetical protein